MSSLSAEGSDPNDAAQPPCGATSSVARDSAPPLPLDLPVSSNPRVSIVVLGWREAPYLLRCLVSLYRNCDGSIPYEVLLFLNEPSPGLSARARQVGGARVAESPVNLGFGGGNNAGAALARGEFIVLLNDDAAVEPGWLEALIAAADLHPNAGVIGSCALNWDGTIHEAGGQLWRDASVSLHGKGQPATTAEFAGIRPVEFVSGCSFLVRRGLWNALGGFDRRFYPAYYEDVDLCLRVRAAGFDVLCAGGSRLRHGGPASVPGWLRSFMITRNAALLRRLWTAELEAKPPPPPEATLPWTAPIDESAAMSDERIRVPTEVQAIVEPLERERTLYRAYAAAIEGAVQARERALLADLESVRAWATGLAHHQQARELEFASAQEALQRWALELQRRVDEREGKAVRGLRRLRAAGVRLRSLAKI